MGKIIKYLFLAIIFFGIIGIVFNNDSDDSAAKARLEKATQSQKNCVTDVLL